MKEAEELNPAPLTPTAVWTTVATHASPEGAAPGPCLALPPAPACLVLPPRKRACPQTWGALRGRLSGLQTLLLKW